MLKCVVAKKMGLSYHLLVDMGCSKAPSGERKVRSWAGQVTKKRAGGSLIARFFAVPATDDVVGKRGKKQILYNLHYLTIILT